MVSEHQPKNGNQHQQAAGLGIDEELGGRADPRTAPGAAVAPQRDQEIHRHQHHFPEQEEQEQVDSEKDPDHATENPQQVEVEESDPLHDLLPRADHGHGAEQPGQRDHQQRQSVDRQMYLNAETWNPVGLPLQRPGVGGTFRRQAEVATDPQPQHHRQLEQHGAKRDPAWRLVAEAFGLPAQQAANEGDQYQPDQSHESAIRDRVNSVCSRHDVAEPPALCIVPALMCQPTSRKASSSVAPSTIDTA